MNNFGLQYNKDDLFDKTGFRKKARLFQSKYRAEILNVGYDEYGNRLTEEDGSKGLNFYNGFLIFEEVKKRYPKFNKGLYCDMLRSEHIPFNLFIPFKHDKSYCKNVFNDLLKNTIKSLDRLEIEYAPSPKEKYLDDNTSFDAYIEYTHINNTKGVLGIEVKYTEHEYKLKKGSKEEALIKNKKSPYYRTSEQSKLYKPEAYKLLPTDKFRQVWRNQLLGESILLEDKDEFSFFTSMTFFPSGNTHFIEVSKEYISFLTNNNNKFDPVTFELFISICKNHCPNINFRQWIDYLSSRYIINETI